MVTVCDNTRIGFLIGAGFGGIIPIYPMIIEYIYAKIYNPPVGGEHVFDNIIRMSVMGLPFSIVFGIIGSVIGLISGIYKGLF